MAASPETEGRIKLDNFLESFGFPEGRSMEVPPMPNLSDAAVEEIKLKAYKSMGEGIPFLQLDWKERIEGEVPGILDQCRRVVERARGIVEGASAGLAQKGVMKKCDQYRSYSSTKYQTDEAALRHRDGKEVCSGWIVAGPSCKIGDFGFSNLEEIPIIEGKSEYIEFYFQGLPTVDFKIRLANRGSNFFNTALANDNVQRTRTSGVDISLRNDGTLSVLRSVTGETRDSSGYGGTNLGNEHERNYSATQEVILGFVLGRNGTLLCGASYFPNSGSRCYHTSLREVYDGMRQTPKEWSDIFQNGDHLIEARMLRQTAL